MRLDDSVVQTWKFKSYTKSEEIYCNIFICFKVRKKDEEEKYAASIGWFARAGTTRWVLASRVAPRDSACAAILLFEVTFFG